MRKTQLKNLLRAIIGTLSILIPTSTKSKFRIYCNLIGGKVYGGPDRFLKSITTSSKVESEIEISNWGLNGCKSALVFSSSWGNSFSKIAKFFGIKSVLRVDGFYVPEDKIDEKFQQTLDFRQWLNRRLANDLEHFDHIIYQSNFSKRICDKYLYDRKDNFSIIHNGTNVRKFTPKTNHKNEKFKILLLGKHYPKHLNLAINILSEVIKEIEADLVIVGPMRNGEEGVQKYIDSLNLDSNLLDSVKVLGTKSYDQLPDILRESDLFLHVKVGDWCPNAVLEAMASGLPVVCPSWGGTEELVGEAGISIPGPEWEVSDELTAGMTNAVIKIRNDLSNYKRKARERAEKHFDIENVSLEYLNVLEFQENQIKDS